MNAENEKLDARLRGLFGRLDAGAGFEARVMARVVARPAQAGEREDLRAQFERRLEQTRRRLAREAWTNGLTLAGIGVAAGALVWRYAPEISQWLTRDHTDLLDPLQIGGFSSVVLLAILWPLLRKLPLLRNF